MEDSCEPRFSGILRHSRMSEIPLSATPGREFGYAQRVLNMKKENHDWNVL